MRKMLESLLVWLRLKKPRAPVPDPQDLRELYLKSGLQYEIAARYAAFAGFVPVCGVLFHHAIEMYLKGQLCLSLSEPQLRCLGHKLKKVWKRFQKGSAERIIVSV
jgi:hypothetical protein